MGALATATSAVNVALALGVCLACTAIGAKTSRTTRCAIRLAIFAIFVGALAKVLGGWLAFGDWPEVVLLGGVLIYMVANARDPVALEIRRWANVVAWLVAIVLLVLVGWTLSVEASA